MRSSRHDGVQISCCVCILNCLSKVTASFPVLLLGRLLSGVSTSCLYSVFESWWDKENLASNILLSKYYCRYVNEHKSRGLPSSLLAGTMALVTSCNSALAITAGPLSC